MGTLLRTGHYDATRVVAVGGSEMMNPRHLRTKTGAQLSGLGLEVKEGARLISGNRGVRDPPRSLGSNLLSPLYALPRELFLGI